MSEEKQKETRGKVKVRIVAHHGRRFGRRYYFDDVLDFPKDQADSLIKDGEAVPA
jgi:hypothetical protein